MAEPLDGFGIDVLPNLNHRQLARSRNFPPRLGGFPDVPDLMFPSSEEIEAWEQAYQAHTIGGLVVIRPSTDDQESESSLWQTWSESYDADRVFVSFAADQVEQARQIASVASTLGFATELFAGDRNATEAGHFYATASQRLALDSREARRLESAVTEFNYLGERVRRNSNSIFRDASGDRNVARQEPAVFLKESLGDEFSESTVREIIVPGGVALGESAYLAQNIRAMRFIDDRLQLIGEEAEVWRLPDIDSKTLKALFDFTQRSHRIQSDAIVDIDADGRVRISSALRDTDAGYQIMHADTLPFEYVRNLNVTKSVIVDVGVDWFSSGTDALQFVTGYEVRFLSADNMRLAQTRVALEYEFESISGESTYQDNWGRDASRLRENLDYAGLGRDMNEIARYAGWIALLRKALDDEISFLDGRYEFMKIDKRGRETPSRY
ncbi:MAG: hypothetical protein MI746_12820 [Pseudomonadales bacterium]|nr:hypothetical protein [Pseudomonadales bacterium]